MSKQKRASKVAGKGYFKLYRKIFSSKLFEQDKPACLFFIFLINRAKWKTVKKKWRGREFRLERGECWETERQLAEFYWEGKYSTKERSAQRAQVRRWLTKLEKTIHIERKNGPHGTFITVCNYNKYQGPSEQIVPPKKRKKALPEEASSLPQESQIPATDNSGAEAVLAIYNKNRPNTAPSLGLNELTEKALKTANEAWQHNANAAFWVEVVKRTHESLWLTGQTPGKNGIAFETSDLFYHLCRPGHAELILAGKYDNWASKPTARQSGPAMPQGSESTMGALTRPESLHNVTDMLRHESPKKRSGGWKTEINPAKMNNGDQFDPSLLGAFHTPIPSKTEVDFLKNKYRLKAGDEGRALQ